MVDVNESDILQAKRKLILSQNKPKIVSLFTC